MAHLTNYTDFPVSPSEGMYCVNGELWLYNGLDWELPNTIPTLKSKENAFTPGLFSIIKYLLKAVKSISVENLTGTIPLRLIGTNKPPKRAVLASNNLWDADPYRMSMLVSEEAPRGVSAYVDGDEVILRLHTKDTSANLRYDGSRLSITADSFQVDTALITNSVTTVGLTTDTATVNGDLTCDVLRFSECESVVPVNCGGMGMDLTSHAGVPVIHMGVVSVVPAIGDGDFVRCGASAVNLGSIVAGDSFTVQGCMSSISTASSAPECSVSYLDTTPSNISVCSDTKSSMRIGAAGSSIALASDLHIEGGLRLSSRQLSPSPNVVLPTASSLLSLHLSDHTSLTLPPCDGSILLIAITNPLKKSVSINNSVPVVPLSQSILLLVCVGSVWFWR